jgi:hypothetical protein
LSLSEYSAEIARHYAGNGRAWKLIHYSFVLVPTLAYMGWGLVCRRKHLGRCMSALLLCSLPVAVFFAVAPAHTCNPELLNGIFNRYDARGVPEIAQVVENFFLYTECFLLDSSALLGLLLLAAPFWQLRRLRERGPLSLPLIVCIVYYLAVMRIGVFPQVFYLLPLLPVVIVFAAELLCRWMKSCPMLAMAYLLAAVSVWGFQMHRCHPDYGLIAYPYVGERYLFGHATLGYTCVCHVEHDSASDAIDWVLANAEPGAHVIMNLPDHLMADGARPDLDLRWVNTGSWVDRVSLMRSDYVASYFHFEIDESWGSGWPTGDIHLYPYDRAFLMEHFDKVLSIRRAFDVEVASVWRRKNLPGKVKLETVR